VIRHVDTFNVVIGLSLIVGALAWAARLVRFAHIGEIHLVMNAAGGGLLGQVRRSEKSVLFWIVLSANAALIAGFVIFFFVFVVLS